MSLKRRHFLQTSALAVGAASASAVPLFAAATRPKITFYGSTQQVSGSCHIFECSQGLFVIDAGLFYADIPNHEKENESFPFNPRDVKAFFLTHGHVDHNGRVPLLVRQGFRGPIYCTDATRDLTGVMLEMSARLGEDKDYPLYTSEDVEAMMKLIKPVPYNKKMELEGLQVRYTDAGHILGSAMVEVWVDGVKVIFGGDMGPDDSPILCKPTQHFGADAVLVESTYGPAPRQKIDFHEFGEKIMRVIKRGGSVLIPAFALHKTQCVVFMLNQLVREGIIDKNIPIFSDSGTAQLCTQIYESYKDYYDPEAKDFKGSLFYRNKFLEARSSATLKTHGKGPAIYISTSGMLDHAAAPKHLYEMAQDSRNAVMIVGYQAPDTVGRKLLDGAERIEIPWDEDGKTSYKSTNIKLEVIKQSGFSSHAKGQQILEWVERFEKIGQLFVVHGDVEQSTGLAAAAKQMGVAAVAPLRGQEFEIHKDRVSPGRVPDLTKEKYSQSGKTKELSVVDK